MIEALLALPPNAALALASALELGTIRPPFTRASVGATVGATLRDVTLVDGVASSLTALQATGASGRSTGAWLRALVASRRRVPSPSLVWSGPQMPGLHQRETDTVLAELFQTVRDELWVTTYVVVGGRKLLAPLATRMDARPGLAVTVLVDIKRAQGDVRPTSQVAEAFARDFWAQNWPSGSRRPRLLHYPRSLEPDTADRASMHAKVVVADGQRVLVTSSNLTTRGVTENVEVGVVLHDRALAATLVDHFRSLVDAGHLAEVSG